jgi:molybdate transport system ATP-binding protein
MSDVLAAEFGKQRGDFTVQASLRRPADSASVTVLFGPSGCGKTTILRCLAGLERPESGSIHCGAVTWFDAAQRVHRSPQQRGVGFVFQDYALFPHLSVAENIGFGLPATERAERVESLLRTFELSGLAARRPQQISGGQQQRVALARALARRPRLLLLDEPLSALDAGLRDTLRGELRRLLRSFAIPVVLVTHERTEVMALADEVIVMRAGAVLQRGGVTTVFSQPADLAVAGIVGMETVVAGDIVGEREGLATVRVGLALLTAVLPPDIGTAVYVCLRGEDVILQAGTPAASSVRNQLLATVTSLTWEGALVRVGLDVGFPLTALITRPACEELALREGDRVIAAIKAPAIHLLPRE